MISGVILARNESANIGDCIHCLRPYVSEIILIDMDSEDDTVAIAKPLVDSIINHELISNFDVARNAAITVARNEWMWFVDADERISQQAGDLVNQLVSSRGDEFAAICTPFKSYFCGKWMRNCGWWPGYTMPRVLKRGKFTFNDKLHSGVNVDGETILLPAEEDVGIDHFSYRSVEHYLEKLNRYTSTEADQLFKDGKHWDWREASFEMVRDLWSYYELHPGFLDGKHGWILAWLSGQYRWLSRAKLIDKVDVAEPDSAPKDLNEVFGYMSDCLAALRATRPTLPLGVVWRSPFWDTSGYATDARSMVKALALGERHLLLKEFRWNDSRAKIPVSDEALFKSLFRAERPSCVIAINQTIPSFSQPEFAAAVNVIRTTFETDRIPNDWRAHLQNYREIWVMSDFNRESFRAAGIAPELIRVVPGCLDTDLYRPEGDNYSFPDELSGRFIFLTVLDWAYRKGWDVLLRAWCRTFGSTDQTAIFLKVTRSHGHSIELIRNQASEVCREEGVEIDDHPELIISDKQLNELEMSALYRSANAFVLPTRGEGWGRPFLEAMASGTPVIGTGASGNMQFMTEQNSFLVRANRCPIPEHAYLEIPVYRGHQWYEPEVDHLGELMRGVVENPGNACQRADLALKDVRENFSLSAGLARMETAISSIEREIAPTPLRNVSNEIRVQFEGELFASHSFSNINERVVDLLGADEQLAVSVNRLQYFPTTDAVGGETKRLLQYVDRDLNGEPDVVIRHAYPPNWNPPESGKWIHMQPWEFGYLPKDWVEPLTTHVNEIWAASNYVKDVYLRSGIPREKIHVIPYGFDENWFNPTATPLILPTEKSFKFLFVGGTTHRKGFDRLLNAYVEEFTCMDDVCLVVKDLGANTFYRGDNHRERVRELQQDNSLPEILYYDSDFSAGQRASLYTACDCLAAPYRGEGFGLPVLEAMACGIPAIIPRGGPTDDFSTDETCYFLNSYFRPTGPNENMCGEPTELDVSHTELRKQLRAVSECRSEAQRKGSFAASHVVKEYKWSCVAKAMSERICIMMGRNTVHSAPRPCEEKILVACFPFADSESVIADHLARLAPFVDEVVLASVNCSDRSAIIAREYGAKVIHASTFDEAIPRCEEASSSQWIFSLNAGMQIDVEAIRAAREIAKRQSPQIVSFVVAGSDGVKYEIRRRSKK